MIGARTPDTSMIRRLVSKCHIVTQRTTATANRKAATNITTCAEVANPNPGNGRPSSNNVVASNVQVTNQAAESKRGRQGEGLTAINTISPPSTTPPGTATHRDATSDARAGDSDNTAENNP